MKTSKKIIRSAPKRLSIAATTKEKIKEKYEKDFSQWATDQAKLLKKKEFSKLDIDNLIEEIEGLGKSEKRTLESYLENLLIHKLKIDHQPKKHTKSWDISIELATHKAQKTLQENPSLKPKLKDILKESYYSARLRASSETKLDRESFPEDCPWTLKEIFPDLEKKYW